MARREGERRRSEDARRSGRVETGNEDGDEDNKEGGKRRKRLKLVLKGPVGPRASRPARPRPRQPRCSAETVLRLGWAAAPWDA